MDGEQVSLNDVDPQQGDTSGQVAVIVLEQLPTKTACDKAVQHPLRPVCSSCDCLLTEHDDFGESEIRAIRKKLHVPKPEVLTEKYSWTPADLDEQKIEEYMSQLTASDVPTLENKSRSRAQLLKQVPFSDLLKLSHVSLKNKDEVRLYEKQAKERDLEVLGVGDIAPTEEEGLACARCDKTIPTGNLAVFSDVTENVWHPNCFRCETCTELLSELIHCFDDGDVLCVRHYGDLCRNRCNGCDQLIFASEYTKSKGLFYHMEHYNCSQCSEPLTGKRYVLRQDQPTCLPCYEDKFANRCEKCEKPIGTDFKDLSYKGRHWHEACFLCWGCQNSLANQQFVAKDSGLYCPDCYDSSFAQRCDQCNNTFKHGMQKFEYNGKKFHNECFCCAECKNPIGNNSFVPKDEDKLVCMSCYNDKFAQKCGKCSEVLLQGGVTFREVAYHRECFLCSTCNTELANVKFATKDDQPYCPDCYIKTFAKICEKCTKPIAGLGQATKYVAFEGRQWHAECFMCAQCDKSLLGQGFLVCNTQVVCPDCGKNM